MELKIHILNAEIIKLPEYYEANPIHINYSTSEKTNQFNNTLNRDGALAVKDLMTILTHNNAISNIETGCKKPLPIKRTLKEILHTEISLLECTHEIRMALQNNHADCKKAVVALDKMSGLKFINAFTIIKHKEVIDTIFSVSKYVGNASEWNLNKQETIQFVKTSKRIRSKAKAIFNKFVALFNVPDGKTFQEVFDKRVEDFNKVAERLNCYNMYRLTSTEFEIIHTEVCLLDCIGKLQFFLIYHANFDKALKVLEEMNELEFINTFMLVKHQEVVYTVKQVSDYVENPDEFVLNEQETIQFIEKAKQVRSKAVVIFNKFKALFNVSDGKQFAEVFHRGLKDYNMLTKHFNYNQIYNFTFAEFEILHTEICLLDCVGRIQFFLGPVSSFHEALKVLEELNELKFINPTMLVKHKEVVLTIKYVSNYMKNPDEFVLNELAKQIRNKAVEILNKFEDLFDVPYRKTFFEIFNISEENLNTETNDLDCQQIVELQSQDNNTKEKDTKNIAKGKKSKPKKKKSKVKNPQQ